MSGSLITTDNDYSYIEVFIKYMKEIISMIQRLFSKKDVNTGEDLDATTAE